MDENKRNWLRWVVFIVTLGFIVLILFDYHSSKQKLIEEIDDQTDEILTSFITEVDRFTSRRIGDVELMADYIPYILGNEKELTEFLRRQHDVMDYFASIGFIKPDGTILAADGSKQQVKQPESFNRALQGEVAISDPFPLAQHPDERVTAIAVPARDENGEVIGVLSGVINIEYLINDLTNATSLPGVVYFMKNGELIYSYPTERKLRTEHTDPEKLQKIVDNHFGTMFLDHQGRLVKYGESNTGWLVIADSEGNPKLDSVRNLLWRMVALLTLTITVAAGIYMYSQYIGKQAETRQKRDLLTGLPNRLQLEEDMKNRAAVWRAKHIGLFFVRIDHFSDVIDRFGYQAGDRILLRTADTLEEAAYAGKVYRTDYEVFMLAAKCDSESDAVKIGEGIVQLMYSVLPIASGAKVNLSASVGAVLAEADLSEDLLLNGNYACQESAKAGGNQFTLYTEAMDEASREQLRRARCLSTALERNEFYMVYQPIYSLQEKRIIGFESLIRWRSPELGEVGPFQFIPLLEQDNAIVETGRWIMNTVAEQVNEWRKLEKEHFTVNVNVSVKQLHHEDFLKDVARMLKETGVDPAYLVFEVTESVFVEKINEVIHILRTLNDWGIKTAVDDFGTGYSSLSSLTALPFQYLKVDRAFILAVERKEPGSEAILKGILGIARALNQTTVLEGVETEEQLLLLKSFGAERIQGYFFSKPMEAGEAVKMLGKKMDY